MVHLLTDFFLSACTIYVKFDLFTMNTCKNIFSTAYYAHFTKQNYAAHLNVLVNEKQTSIDHSRHQDKKKTNHVHIYTLFRTCECCNPSNSEVPVAKSFCFQKEIKSVVLPTFKTHCFSGAHATGDNLIDSIGFSRR